jgi:hypothetical protein
MFQVYSMEVPGITWFQWCGEIDSPPETLRERLVLNTMGVHDSREIGEFDH